MTDIARKLRMGMVGGGKGAFIGEVHRMAARLDGGIDLVAGCFSSQPERARASGRQLHVADHRNYDTYEAMVRAEAALPADERIDFVTIVTPNHMHYPVAKSFLEAGFNVVCDKPLTSTLDDALALRDLVRRSGKVFALTHNYTGYPMVKEARARVQRGDLGRILKIVAEYPQGWLASKLEESGNKQAGWRTDPTQSGKSCCLGDIGTHAENLGRYITGLEIEALCAEFTTFVEGRPLEDDANLLIRYVGGAKGVLHASQISIGEENGLNIRIYGDKGSLAWRQERPTELYLRYNDRPGEILRPGNGYLSPQGLGATRIPAGHPEAFIEAFANIYRSAAEAIHDEVSGRFPRKSGYDFPGIEDGVVGMLFLETAVESATSTTKWTAMKQL